MILENLLPRLKDLIEKSNTLYESQELTLIYQELLTHDSIYSVFEWLMKNSIEYTTRYDEYRFVIIVHPKKQENRVKVDPADVKLLEDFITSLKLGRVMADGDGEDEIRGNTSEDINAFLRKRK